MKKFKKAFLIFNYVLIGVLLLTAIQSGLEVGTFVINVFFIIYTLIVIHFLDEDLTRNNNTPDTSANHPAIE